VEEERPDALEMAKEKNEEGKAQESLEVDFWLTVTFS